tara:strand:- start:283 stop:645 length:363 start_codon:yes stop_codon:yes gene_type:complete
MGKATNSIVKSRVDALKALILSGSSNSVCVEHASQHWGLSRRQSYRLLKRAWSEVREDVDSAGIDRQEMLCWCLHQLMAAAGEGFKNKQPSVTVGACRELAALLGLGFSSAHSGRYGWRR